MKKCIYRISSILATLMLIFSIVPISESAAGKSSEFEIRPVGRKEPIEISLGYSSAEQMLSDMKKICTKGLLTLYFHEKYLIAAVKDAATGEIYSTNPYNADQDSFSTGQIKKLLRSQIVLNYSDGSGKVQTLYSADDCVSLGQYEISYTDNGVAVTYSLGAEKSRLLVPEMIGTEDFEAILKCLSDNSRAVRRLKILYKKAISDDGQSVYAVKKLSDKEQNEVDGYFASAGYTIEDLDADYQRFGLTPPDAFFPNFQLVLEYSLTENGLRVNLPANKFRYDTKHFYITDIKLLEYFGAVNALERHDGYVFLPDGAGTLLRFDDTTRNKQQLISGQVYGFDSAVSYPEEPRQGRAFHLPVFGIKKDDAGFFAIITNGASMATLSGYAGQQFGRYFAAFSTFRHTTREEQELEQKVSSFGSNSIAYLYDKNVYTDSYTIDYTFLNKQNSSYVGMAKLYQDYLIKQGLKKSDQGECHTLSIETVGTLTHTDRFLGIPYKAAAKLTTFRQNQEILEYFQGKGIQNLNLSLTAWRKNGLDGTAANRVDPALALGGKNGLSELNTWCEANDIKLYPDFDLAYVACDKWFDGFSANKDVSRLLNDHFGGLMTVSPDSSRYDRSTFLYALSPRCYSAYVEKIQKGADKIGLTGLGFGSIGKYLNSDFRSQKEINRQQSANLICKNMKTASENYNLMFDGCNAYVLPYASFVRNIPMSDSGFAGTTAVPFMQLVLNGTIPYASEPINMQNNSERALLECIETGTSPHYVLAMDNILKIKLTQHTNYYSIDGRYWLKSAADNYLRYESTMKAVKGAFIVTHEKITDDVVRIDWSNGTTVYVNYSNATYRDDNVTVPGMDSVVIGRENT